MKRASHTLMTALVIAAMHAGALAQSPYGTPLDLEGVIAIALDQNRDIKNALEETSRADYQVIEATAGALPQVNGFMDTQKTLKQQVFIIDFPDSTGKISRNRLKVGTDYNASLGATLTQPLYVGGKVGTARQAAKIYQNISGRTLDAVKQNVVMGVEQAFNGVLLAREVESISRESLAQAEKHMVNVQHMHDAGAATEYDLLRAQVNVSNLRPSVIAAENGVRVALLTLKDIMGIDSETPLDITGELVEPDSALIRRASAEYAIANRPDLEASRGNIDLLDKNVRLVRGDFLPTVSAGTTFMYMGNFDQLKYRADDWTPYWYASISVSIPIFTGFRNYARYQQAKIDRSRAEIDYRKLRTSTEIEVEQAVMTLRESIESIESQKLNIEQAGRALEMAQDRYTSGAATQLEVLDAQLALEIARNNMAQSLFAGMNAEINLRKSLGLITTDAHERNR